MEKIEFRKKVLRKNFNSLFSFSFREQNVPSLSFQKGFRASINRNKIDSRIYPINRREEMISLDTR